MLLMYKQRKNNIPTQKNRGLSDKEEGVNSIEYLFVKA